MKGSGNGFLYKLFLQGTLQASIDLIGLLRSPEETLKEHMEIIDAIEKRHLDLAEALTKMHLENTKELILKRING